MLSMLDNGRLKRMQEGLIYSTGLLSFSVRGKDERQLSFCGGNSLSLPPIPAEYSGDIASSSFFFFFSGDFSCLLVGVEVEVTGTGNKRTRLLVLQCIKESRCLCVLLHTYLSATSALKMRLKVE